MSINKSDRTMTKFLLKKSNCDLDPDPNNLKPKPFQAIIIPYITVMLYQNWLMNEVARTMIKCEHVCRLREHNSAIMLYIKLHFLHAHAQFMSDLCSKFPMPAYYRRSCGATNSPTV